MQGYPKMCCVLIFFVAFSAQCQSEPYEIERPLGNSEMVKMIPCNGECSSQQDKNFVKAKVISPTCPSSNFIYPKKMINLKAEGNSGILLTISKTGTLTKTEVYESSGYDDLDNAAIKGFKLCKFTPAIKNGEKIESKLQVKYPWRIP